MSFWRMTGLPPTVSLLAVPLVIENDEQGLLLGVAGVGCWLQVGELTIPEMLVKVFFPLTVNLVSPALVMVDRP